MDSSHYKNSLENCSSAVWDGFVPIEFILSESSLATTQRPHPFYVLASRMGYLPAVAIDAVECFRSSAVDMSSDVWFETAFDSIPLQSNIPIGCLYDIYAKETGCEDAIKPWTIQIHFQSFPTKVLLRCSSIEESKRLFNHSLKQALYVIYGNSSKFAGQSVENKLLLWEAVRTGEYIKFNQITTALRPSSPLKIRCIPVRVLLYADSSFRTLQKPISAIKPSSEVTTLRDAISINLPTCDLCEMEDYVLIQGVRIPFNAPLFELWCAFAHADLFLYICINRS